MKRIRGKKHPLCSAGLHAFRDEYTRTLARTNLPDGQAGVTYYYDGAAIVRRMRLEKIGNEWKIAPGQN